MSDPYRLPASDPPKPVPWFNSHWFVECVLYGPWMLWPALLEMAFLMAIAYFNVSLFEVWLALSLTVALTGQFAWFFYDEFHRVEKIPGWSRPEWYWRRLDASYLSHHATTF